MAKGAAKAQEPENPSPKKGSKLIIVLVAIIITLVAGGAAAGLFLIKKKDDAKHKEEKLEDAQEEKKGPPAFTVLEPFVVNLASPDSHRYLQIGITYEANNPKIAEQLKLYTPVLRSRILLVLSSKNVTQLTSIEGKQQLMDELVDLARVSIEGDEKSKNKGVRDVHFSSFVIQ